MIIPDFQKFSKENTQGIKLTKFNGHHEKSTYLYVGSSNSLKKRFEQHCGKVHNKTYALKLSKWLTNTSVKINFFYVEVTDIDQLILQHLEDGLWRALKPMFGKSGGNNK